MRRVIQLSCALAALAALACTPAAAVAQPSEGGTGVDAGTVADARDDGAAPGRATTASASARAAAVRALARTSRRLARAQIAASTENCTTCSLGDRLLALGARGKDVRSLQRLLRKVGYSAQKVTGRLDRLTERKVVRFQRKWSLDQDGVVGAMTLGALRRAANGEKPPKGGGGGIAGIPAAMVRNYKNAGTRYKVDWRLLAAVGKLETNHGQSNLPGVHSGVNFSGCCAGVMQFCVVSSCGNTWGSIGVDGNGDGRVSVYNAADAVASAGRYMVTLRRIVGNRKGLMLAAYNAGPGNVQRYNGVPPFSETRSYVSRGLAYIDSLPS